MVACGRIFFFQIGTGKETMWLGGGQETEKDWERQRECQRPSLAFAYLNSILQPWLSWAIDGLRYEFLIRQLIGYERGHNPIEKAFSSKQGQVIAYPWETAPCSALKMYVYMYMYMYMLVYISVCVHLYNFPFKKSQNKHFMMINV